MSSASRIHRSRLAPGRWQVVQEDFEAQWAVEASPRLFVAFDSARGEQQQRKQQLSYRHEPHSSKRFAPASSTAWRRFEECPSRGSGGYPRRRRREPRKRRIRASRPSKRVPFRPQPSPAGRIFRNISPRCSVRGASLQLSTREGRQRAASLRISRLRSSARRRFSASCACSESLSYSFCRSLFNPARKSRSA